MRRTPNRRPFVEPSRQYPGLVDDTAIGKVIDGIGGWALRQGNAAMAKLAITPADSVSEIEVKAEELLGYAVGIEKWPQIRAMVDRLEAEDAALRARAASKVSN